MHFRGTGSEGSAVNDITSNSKIARIKNSAPNTTWLLTLFFYVAKKANGKNVTSIIFVLSIYQGIFRQSRYCDEIFHLECVVI